MKTATTTLDSEVAGVGRARPASAPALRVPRIFYAAGNGNIMGTYQHWKDQKDDPSQLSMTYSGQFFDTCRRLGAEGLVLSHDAHTGKLRDGRITIRQRRPARFGNGPAIAYHIEQFIGALRVIAMAIWFRADVVLAASGACHWFPLAVLPLFGIKVVPALHCVLWPKYRRPGRLGRLVIGLDKMLFTRAASALMTASYDIDEQLKELAGKRASGLKVLPFLPTYRSEHLPLKVTPPKSSGFRVLYAGRVVAEKGVFDLLKVAAMLPNDVTFDICGTGGALEEMKKSAAPLGDRFRFHGHCQRHVMVEMFRTCRAVIVPTTTDFVEGFNQVVAEAILAGRPVVTSDVCPAIKYVGDAAVVVPPDDVSAYAQAIARLAKDVGFYQHCVDACGTAREQFFDENRGWAAALEKAVHLAVPEYAT